MVIISHSVLIPRKQNLINTKYNWSVIYVWDKVFIDATMKKEQKQCCRFRMDYEP